MQEQELIDQIKSGDAGAFTAFFDKYKKLVLNVCYKLVGNKDEAEDLTQEVFLKVYRSAPTFQHDSKVSTWIYRIAVNVCLNHLRKKKYLRWFSLDILSDSPKNEPTVDLPVDMENCPDRLLENKEQANIVWQAINSLPESQKAAIVLQKYEGFSCQEIAEIMNCSEGAVHARLHRAKARLYQLLIPYLKHF